MTLADKAPAGQAATPAEPPEDVSRRGIGDMIGDVCGTNRPRGKRLTTTQNVARSVTRTVTTRVVGGLAAEIGKSVGGTLGGSIGRAVVRGVLGSILRR